MIIKYQKCICAVQKISICHSHRAPTSAYQGSHTIIQYPTFFTERSNPGYIYLIVLDSVVTHPLVWRCIAQKWLCKLIHSPRSGRNKWIPNRATSHNNTARAVSNISSALNIFIELVIFKSAKDTFVYVSHFLVSFLLNLFIILVFEKHLKGGSPLHSPFQNAQHHHNHETKAVVSSRTAINTTFQNGCSSLTIHKMKSQNL
jgi:hypothetical protein